MIRAVFLLAFLFFFMGIALDANAQINPEKGEPLEITADGSLEWHRNDNFFKAVKRVRATQGDTTLRASILIAKYREDAGGSMQIYEIICTGNVIIESATSKAYGSRAVYNIDKGLAVMTGKNLKLVSPDQTVTAKERFEYLVAVGKLKAIGDAVAVRENDTIKADQMSAVFEENAEGKRVLKTMDATGNVVITTQEEVLTGDYAIYTADTDIAKMTGGVKITRGENVIEGKTAQVDLKTNISSIFGAEGSSETGEETGSGRVRAVFVPGSEKKPE